MRSFPYFMNTICAVQFIWLGALRAENPSLILEQKVPLQGVEGKLDHLAVDAKGKRLFVANKVNNTLDIIDLQANKLIKQIPDQIKVSGVDYSADLNMLFVGNGDGHCNAFECKDFKKVFSVKAAGADNLHYQASTRLVYVANDESLTVLDAQTGETKGLVKLPGHSQGFALDEKNARIYIVIQKPQLIGLIDLKKYEVVEKFPVTLSDIPSPIAFSASDERLFIGCRQKPCILVMDSRTGKELTTVAIPGGVDDVHYDPKTKRIFASCGEKSLIAIEKKGEKYEMISSCTTPALAKTCAYSPELNKIYLAVPKQKDTTGPEVRIYSIKP